jgi:hypothetical protein
MGEKPKFKLPDSNDRSIEDVKRILYVLEKAEREYFHEHFDQEDNCEEQVAVFDDRGEKFRLKQGKRIRVDL